MALAFFRLLFILGLCGGAIYVVLRFLRIWSASRSGIRSETGDPYALFGIARGATEVEIKEAYHRELAKYHPDKVAHLGEDLQALARVKTTAIIAAYQAIRRG